jgi:hypothetical protein
MTASLEDANDDATRMGMMSKECMQSAKTMDSRRVPMMNGAEK